MVREGHTVLACAPENDPGISAQLKAIGVTYHAIPFCRVGTNLRAEAVVLRRLWHFLDQQHPDLIFAYTIKPVIYGSLAARWAGVPRVFSMITGMGHGFVAGGFTGRLLKTTISWLYRFSLRHNRAIFFQNTHDRDCFVALHLIPRKCPSILVNGSGVDLDEFPLAPLPALPCSFLLMARLIAEKGIREYAAAARLLKQRHPRSIFRLAGFFDPRPGSITCTEIESWRREGVIEYVGWLEDVRPAIRASHVYVLPSYYPEGIPHSILEAMSMGRPIVTTDEPGCRQTVHHGVNGFLVPARKAEELAEAMEKFIRHRSWISRMGRESRLLAEALYDVHQVNRVLLETMGLMAPSSQEAQYRLAGHVRRTVSASLE